MSAIEDLRGWAVVISLSFIGWEALSLWNPRFIPDPAGVVIYLLSTDPRELLGNMAITISNSTQGFFLGSLLGIGLICLSYFSDLLRSSIRVLNTVVQSISVLVWTIIFVMVFGVLSFIPSVLVTAMVVLPVVLSNLITSMEAVDEKLLDLTFLLGASRKDELVDVILPSSLPYLTSAARVGYGLALRISVVAEAFGSSGGIGFMIVHCYNLMDPKGVFAWSLFLVVLMIFVDKLVFKPLERYAMRWKL